MFLYPVSQFCLGHPVTLALLDCAVFLVVLQVIAPERESEIDTAVLKHLFVFFSVIHYHSEDVEVRRLLGPVSAKFYTFLEVQLRRPHLTFPVLTSHHFSQIALGVLSTGPTAEWVSIIRSIVQLRLQGGTLAFVSDSFIQFLMECFREMQLITPDHYQSFVDRYVPQAAARRAGQTHPVAVVVAPDRSPKLAALWDVFESVAPRLESLHPYADQIAAILRAKVPPLDWSTRAGKAPLWSQDHTDLFERS